MDSQNGYLFVDKLCPSAQIFNGKSGDFIMEREALRARKHNKEMLKVQIFQGYVH